MLMKDLWACEAGRPHHQGVQALKDHGAVADRDSHLVEAYRDAGFVSFGRTNTPELGAGATTEPLAYGPTHNPRDPRGREVRPAAQPLRSLRVLPAANASDGGGSIRIPAAMCGLVGLKPSRGRDLDGPAHGRVGQLGSARRVSHGATRRRSSTPPSCTFPVMASSHRARTSPTPISSGGIPAGFVSGSSITPSARTPRSIPTLPTPFGRPPPDSRHSATMSSPACPLLLDETRITAWGPAFAAGTAASVAAIAAEIGRDLDDGDIEPWTMFIAERASMFPRRP